MELFARCGREPERLLAITDSGDRITLGDLNAAAERLEKAVGGHRLVFLLCANTPGCLLGYLSCLKAGVAPLLLDAHITPDLLKRLIDVYRPGFFYVPGDLSSETRQTVGAAIPKSETGTTLYAALEAKLDG